MTDPAFAHMYRHRFLPALAEGVQMFKQQHQQPDSALSWLDGVSSPCHQSEGTAHKSVLCRGNDDIITGGGSGNRNSSIDRIVREFGHTVEDAVQWMQKTRCDECIHSYLFVLCVSSFLSMYLQSDI